MGGAGSQTGWLVDEVAALGRRGLPREQYYAELAGRLRRVIDCDAACWHTLDPETRVITGDFTADDATALASVTGAIADGIRTSLRFDAAREALDTSAPGLVILGPRDEIEMITPAAPELLAVMARRRQSEETPPSPLLALAGYVRSKNGLAGPHGDAVAVPSASGWLTLHASLPEGRSARRVAIVIERSSTKQSTAIRLEADGVTPREREIAALLARGLTNPEIADALVLSPYTVQDHIKSLFEKTHVSSRQELVARVYLEDYMPQLAQRAPLTSRGTFGQPELS